MGQINDIEKYMSDREFFENDRVLQEILNPDQAKERLYKELMSKPMMSGNDIINLPCEPNDYLVENILWRDDVGLILAREKVGKTFFTQQLCYSMTCGEPFLGQFDVVKPLKVLYIQAEGSMSSTKERIVESTKREDINWRPDNWRHMFVPSINLDTDDGYEHVINALDSEPEFIPDVIVIDPLYQAMEGDLSDNKAARKWTANVKKIMHKLHCAVLIVHHEHRGKKNVMGDKIEEGDESIMGSFVWKAFVNHVLRITWNKNDGIRRRVKCDTQRNANVIKELEIDLLDPDGVFMIPNSETSSATEEAIYNNIKANGRACVKMVMKQTGMSDSSVRKAFATLYKKKWIEKCPKKGQTQEYKITGGLK